MYNQTSRKIRSMLIRRNKNEKQLDEESRGEVKSYLKKSHEVERSKA